MTIRKAKKVIKAKALANAPFPIPSTTTPPSNRDVMLKTKGYTATFAKVFGPKAEAVRDFFLDDLIPTATALDSGISDAKEVISNCFDGLVPESQQYEATLHGLLKEAITLKLVSFVAKLTNLTAAQKKQFDLLCITKLTGSNNNVSQTILSELHQILGVQRQTQKHTEALLQQVDTGAARSRRNPNSTKR